MRHFSRILSLPRDVKLNCHTNHWTAKGLDMLLSLLSSVKGLIQGIVLRWRVKLSSWLDEVVDVCNIYIYLVDC